MGRPPKSQPGAGQGSLFGEPRYRLGRTELGVNKAIRAAHKARAVDVDLDAGLVAAARDAARAVDRARVADDTWKLVAALRELRETLARLGLDPKSRAGGPRDDLAEFLEKMMTTTRDVEEQERPPA